MLCTAAPQQLEYRSKLKASQRKETYLLNLWTWTFSSVQEFSGHFKTLPTTFLQSGGALAVASNGEPVSTNTSGTVLNCPGSFLTGHFNNGQNGTRLKQLMLISKMWLKSVNVWLRCEFFFLFNLPKSSWNCGLMFLSASICGGRRGAKWQAVCRWMPCASARWEQFYQVPGRVSCFRSLQSEWVTWAISKLQLATITSAHIQSGNIWHLQGWQNHVTVQTNQHYPPCKALYSSPVPSATRLSGAPMGPTSDSSAVLMLLQHTVYIYNLQALPLLGYRDELRATWILELRSGGRKGKRGPNRPAMPPLPGSYRLMGRQGFVWGGWRWTETDGSWQTHTDSQWIQGSLAERSEQGWIKDRLTFKVSHCSVPPRCQHRKRSVYETSVAIFKLARSLY